ncbi:bifunctional glycosyltransferase/CDP-glycerol:glycerophosphate glycerophosphotransferase [Guptibacillus hwajinpoensis]|uniref:bifunctional glycosyltransferase/CDP-glycerol:glycerophosphate glycerophosphotransferase n=1 Tax=Guptibacillus hwajinpoensis TaxID=208199 RepID=UPI001CFDB9F6|nr:bifunctional glycosyltransferase family 2 protein/CDP-glycerol:glycerophosphate glycerophosphotransferase [Pseudalkalibacillus hwajinpoensis]WLR61384.1 bifunctional glycosyltransferase family 2 protein/CDP-glycerol:glycerophosphate glycerophosphotransferase [Pseudalkalibacillus hwajinpoensis]
MGQISVIVTVYNKEDYIEKCLDSLLQQTFQDIEIILINDASTDNSKGIIERYSDSRMTCYHLDKNVGVSKARNMGIEYASSEFIYFVDGDDYLAPYTLELLLNNIGEENFIGGSIFKAGKIAIPMEIGEDSYYLRRLRGGRKIKALRRRSATNLLLRKDFVDDHELRFDEQATFYTDLTFSIPAIVNTEEILMITGVPTYVKGECYDPIDQPTLMLHSVEEKLPDLFYVYHKMKMSYADTKSISRYLDLLLLNYYSKSITNKAVKNSDVLFDHFTALKNSLSLVAPGRIKRRNIIERREHRLLQKGKKEAVLKSMMFRVRLRQWRRSLRKKHLLMRQLYRTVLVKMPMKPKKVLLESFGGKGYSDSPRYIYEELLKSDHKYDYLWVYDKKKKDIPGNPKQVRRLSPAYYYHLATAKYWVSNARMPNFAIKRPETVYLQTWHGTPLKKLAADMKEVRMPGTTTEKYKRNFYNEAQKWDYLVSPNDYSTSIFRRAFKFGKEVLDVGYPRNDILYLEDEEKARRQQEIKAKLGIPADKKVILYAPTWRDDEFHGKGKYKFDLKLNLSEMQARLGDEYVIGLRMHYLIAEHIDTTGMSGFVYNLSDYGDIAELYLLSDILITDYSSVFFDFANLRRPILFFTYDIEKYRDSLRGFYMDFENEAPGPLLKTSDGVIDAIEHIEKIEATYQSNFDAFYDKYCHLDDGHASRKVINRVFEPEKAEM